MKRTNLSNFGKQFDYYKTKDKKMNKQKNPNKTAHKYHTLISKVAPGAWASSSETASCVHMLRFNKQRNTLIYAIQVVTETGQ